MLSFELRSEVEDGENSMGEPIFKWKKVADLKGYLDLFTGDESSSTNSFIEESSHLFMSWDMTIPVTKEDRLYNPRTGYEYEITFVDVPMELGSHYEIYCKKVA